jgi:hypothetical protein
MFAMFAACAHARQSKCDAQQQAVTNRHLRGIVDEGLRTRIDLACEGRFLPAVMNGGQAVMNDTNPAGLSSGILTDERDAPIV